MRAHMGADCEEAEADDEMPGLTGALRVFDDGVSLLGLVDTPGRETS